MKFEWLPGELSQVFSGGSRISPRLGCQLSGGGGCQHAILPHFPKNCMKWKEFGPQGGARVQKKFESESQQFFHVGCGPEFKLKQSGSTFEGI